MGETNTSDQGIGPRWRAMAPGGRCPSERLVLAPGTIADYERLACFHYRAGPPATCALVLTLRDPARDELAGVLLVSHPTLNASWREHAWPGAYTSARCPRPDPGTRSRRLRELAQALNRDLRCISRVVIDPRWRGVGLATRLVRAYLDSPLTRRTEAIAAMGLVSPFFERAGMHRVRVPRRASDWRLLDALAHASAGPLDLLDDRRWRVLAPRHAWIGRELRAWARWRPGVRRWMDDARALARAAGAALLAEPVVYVHEQRDEPHARACDHAAASARQTPPVGVGERGRS